MYPTRDNLPELAACRAESGYLFISFMSCRLRINLYWITIFIKCVKKKIGEILCGSAYFNKHFLNTKI